MRCPECQSKLGYLKLKQNKWQCRNCGKQSTVQDAKQMLKNFIGIPDVK